MAKWPKRQYGQKGRAAGSVGGPTLLFMEPSIWEFGLRLLVATLLGGVIGFERERLNKPAGLRTNMLVALGSAAFTLVGTEALGVVSIAQMETAHPDAFRIDPSRVIAGIVGGVGFLGAGTIIQSRGAVHGVTTAAGIWVCAAVGVAAGVGLYAVAAMITVLGATVLYLGKFENGRIGRERTEREAKRSAYEDRAEGGE